MAEKRKSIVEDSIIEADQIRKAFEVNAKEILTHAMGSEIEQMVKESLEDDLELDDDNGEATDLDVSDDEIGGDTDFNLDLDDEGEDNEFDMELDIDFDDEEGDELNLDIDTDGDDDIDMDLDDMDTDDDVEMVDLTSADDSEVITVFKKMGPTDEIEVVRNGDTIDIKDTQTNAEYRVELGGMGDNMEDEMELDMDMDDEMESLGEGTIYEIEIEDDEFISEDDMEDYSPRRRSRMDDPIGDDDLDPNWNLPRKHRMPRKDREEMNPRNMRGEASRTLGNGRKWGRNGLDKPTAAPRHLRQESEKPRISKLLKENTVLKTDMKTEQSKVQELTENNEKLVGALKILRQKLQEVAVFNSNLTYSVRLMTENATTSDEKVKIIKRMDDAKTVKESKNIYKSLVNELGKKPNTNTIKESVENKLNETKSSGSSAQISESKVYVNPELAKMRKLMDFKYNNK